MGESNSRLNLGKVSFDH